MGQTLQLRIMDKNIKPHLSASIICSDLSNLVKDLKSLEAGGIDSIHFDVMDGVFVPRLGLPPEVLKTIKKNSKLPIYVHLMLNNPEDYLEIFKDAEADFFIVHVENLNHLHRTIYKIKELKCKVGVALNPATSLHSLDYILDDIDLVMLMAINPGIVGHKIIPNIYKKIEDLKNKLISHPKIKIKIDGGVSFESAPLMVNKGADILVCGTSTIFKENESLKDNIKKLRKHLKTYSISPKDE